MYCKRALSIPPFIACPNTQHHYITPVHLTLLLSNPTFLQMPLFESRHKTLLNCIVIESSLLLETFLRIPYKDTNQRPPPLYILVYVIAVIISHPRVLLFTGCDNDDDLAKIRRVPLIALGTRHCLFSSTMLSPTAHNLCICVRTQCLPFPSSQSSH